MKEVMMMYHQKDSWEIPTPKTADECSFCDLEAKPEFLLTPKLIAVSRKLCVDIKREWQMLLIGEETDTGIFAYDYYIPKQETGPATVKNTDEITLELATKNKYIGTMHSHGDIGVSFSHTDDQCTNHSFLKHHIVTNNKNDFMAISRIVLPCGLVKFAKAKVIMKVPAVKSIKGVDNIEEIKFSPSTYYYNSKTNIGYYGNQPYGTNNLPSLYQDGNDIEWKKGSTRQHGFMYDQNEQGGIYDAK